MPNGRPGDHPYTDIVTHDISLYTETVREAVRRVDDYGESGAIQRASSLLWENPEGTTGEELAALEAELESLVEEIERAGDYSGASPLEAVLDGDDSLYDDSVRALVREIHDEIEAEIDNTDRGRRKFSALLWKLGWEPDDLGAVEAELRDFRNDHWVWEK